MKLPIIFFRKLIVGMLLVITAAGLTVVIKESLDTKDPESALPIITIRCADTELQGVYRAGYTWSFFTTVEDRQAPSLAPEDLPITPVDVATAQPLTITFSKTPSSIRVWRAQGRYSTDYMELSSEKAGELSTPNQPGTYVFRVLADWGRRGNIQYFFALTVH